MNHMRGSRFLEIFFTIMTALAIGLPAPRPALAQDKGIRIGRNSHTGKVSFIGAPAGRSIVVPAAQAPGLGVEQRARAIAQAYGTDFGLRQADRELQHTKTRSMRGRNVTRFQQVYQDVPVLGGELVVDATDQGGLISMNGEIAPDLAVDTAPSVAAEQAAASALALVARSQAGSAAEFEASAPALWIYDARLLEPDGTEPALVWRTEVTSKDKALPIRELVLVDAHRGNTVLHFNQDDTAWLARSPSGRTFRSSAISAVSPPAGGAPTASFTAPNVRTYTMNNATSPLPGTLLCNLSMPSCTSGANPHADAAQKYAKGTHDFYQNELLRDSINNAGMAIISSVHFGSQYANAFWNGAQMVYGDQYGFPLADDVVGHELTHGVTQYESNLFYYYQSGAINESLSDVFGELYDQSNGLGTDTAGVKWLMGEDVSGLGAIRSMSNPPAFNDPDKVTSTLYYKGDDDNGGVHINSGVNNKAAYLMVDGGTFNGKSVAAIGADKTLAIYYEAQTNLLTSGADYADLYSDLYQACLNLVGGSSGIVDADCGSVVDALDAVAMNAQPAASYNPEAPLCADGLSPINVFSDNLESGSGKWTFVVKTGTQRWQLGSPYGKFAHSGSKFLYADDYPPATTDVAAQMKSGVAVPANAFLHFAHAYDFEHYLGDPLRYDGGVLEYSTDGGATWKDAGSLMDSNGYNGTIAAGFGNPLKGRQGFTSTSHGYVSTRLNLGSLAGKTVKFRWRMGLDSIGFSWGWWLDDVRIYTCGSFGKLVPANGATDRPPSLTLSWKPVSGASSYEYCYDTTDDNACSQWSKSVLYTSAVISGLDPSTTYYWQVRANTGGGPVEADAGWWSFTTGPLPGAFDKVSPISGAQDQPLSLSLSWIASNGASGYQYCYDTVDNDACDTAWVSTAQTTASISGLSLNTTYYWQVRAVNLFGNTEADGGTGASFTTTTTVYAISGHTSAPGALLTITGSTVSGPVNGTATSSASGDYSIQVPSGWSGSITPSKGGVSFIPPNIGYSDVLSDQPAQDYAARQTFSSIAAADGWILESSETSGSGGSLNATDTKLRVGDDASRRQYRAVLSFSTSPLPDAAVITAASLAISKQSVVGTGDPFALLGGLIVEQRTGFFGASSSLQLDDFSAVASKTMGPFHPSPVGPLYKINLPVGALSFINKQSASGGVTQFRLRFAQDDNNDALANFINFFTGNYGTAGGRPKLIITYHFP